MFAPYRKELDELYNAFPEYQDLINTYKAEGFSDEETYKYVISRIASDKHTVEKTSMAELVKSKAVSGEQANADVAGIMGVEIPKVKEEVVGDTPQELADAYTGLIGWAALGNVAGLALVAATSAASSIPLLGTGEALDEIWRVPAIRSAMEISSDALLGYYTYIQRPLMQRHLLSVHRPLIPESYRLAIAAAKGILDDDSYKQAMAENGLSNKWADIYRDENESFPDLTETLALYRRGIVDDYWALIYLERQGFAEGTAKNLLQLNAVIPPLQDLINMAVKEAFGDHSGEAQLPELRNWAKKMGLSDYFTDAYWYAHWDRIPLQQMYANLYRGYWDKDKFIDMLRIKDVHKDDREAIYNVAYQVPSLRELGYGWDAGIYVEEDIQRYRMWEGLSPEDAKLAAKSMVAYRTEAEREAVRREYMHLFAQGKITEDDFREKLTNLITAKEAIELWVERGKLEGQRTTNPDIEPTVKIVPVSAIEYMYKHGIMDREAAKYNLLYRNYKDPDANMYLTIWDKELEEAKPVEKPAELSLPSASEVLWDYENIKGDEALLRSRLKALDWTDERIELAVTRAKAEVALSVAPKTLTRTDYKALFDAGVIGKDALVAKYVSLNYTKEDADLLAMYDSVSIRFPDLRDLYKNGWITAEKMKDELVALGLPEARAEELMQTVIKYDSGLRVVAEKDLTKAEIIKGWKNGIIGTDLATNLLEDLGYSEDEANYLLAINQVVAKADPEGYWEMKKVTEAYKKALGQKSKEVPNDLLIWEQRYKQLKSELSELQAKGASDDEISKKAIQLADVEANYRRLMQDWQRSAT